MRAALGGMLAVDERIILLAVLVGMRKHHLDVVALQMDDRIERIGSQVLAQQVEEAVAAVIAFPVEIYLEYGVEIGVIVDHRLHEVQIVAVVAEERIVGPETHHGPVLFPRRLRFTLMQQIAALEVHAHHLSFAHAPDLAFRGKRVHRLEAHAVKAYRLLEILVVELASGIDFRSHLLHFAERDSASVVAHRNLPPRQ